MNAEGVRGACRELSGLGRRPTLATQENLVAVAAGRGLDRHRTTQARCGAGRD